MYYCNHCDTNVSRSVFFKHKLLLGNRKRKQPESSNHDETSVGLPVPDPESERLGFASIQLQHEFFEISNLQTRYTQGRVTSAAAIELLTLSMIKIDAIQPTCETERIRRKEIIDIAESSIKSIERGIQIPSNKDTEQNEEMCTGPQYDQASPTHADVQQEPDMMQLGNTEEDLQEVYNINKLQQANSRKGSSLIYIMTVFLLSWQKKFNIADKALAALLTFFRIVMIDFAELFELPAMFDIISEQFPSSLFRARSLLDLDRDDFIKYVVCSECQAVYDFNECQENTPTGPRSKLCSYVQFPNHPQKRMRKKCGNPLLLKSKSVLTGKTWLYPAKVYCYKSVKETLSTLFGREGFLEKCQQWRQRDQTDGLFSDIYDGKIWKEWNESNYFDNKTNLSATLNVDWFQPFKHTQDSVGAIYLILNNLPREERYKDENMILVGLMPGPHEPKLHMNGYLRPLVNELCELESGVFMPNLSNLGDFCRLRLMCVAADIPACRKCAGFVGHGALHGCSRCTRAFPRQFGDKADYSGHKVKDPMRTDANHKHQANEARNAKTKDAMHEIEQKFGARWSELFRLNYYSPIRMPIIDPMHNFLLGSAKCHIKLLRSLDRFSDDDLKNMQFGVDNMKVPSDIGRIPRKLETDFSGFTADQWKNFVLVYSKVVLKEILPKDDYDCWSLFVEACRFICNRVLTIDDINLADEAISKYLKSFKHLYGQEKMNMNHHLHLHLKDILLDFGPIYGYWCMAFERYNGMLGNFPSNNKIIEPQIMRHFVTKLHLDSFNWPNDSAKFKDILTSENSSVGSVHTSMNGKDVSEVRKNVVAPIYTINFQKDKFISSKDDGSSFVINTEDSTHLKKMFSALYPSHVIETVLRFANRLDRINYAGEVFSGVSTRSSNSSIISGRWIKNENDTVCIDPESETARNGIITDIMTCEAILVRNPSGIKEQVKLKVARVLWFKTRDITNYYGIGEKICDYNFEEENETKFIPIQRIGGRCGMLKRSIPLDANKPSGGKQTVCAVVPLNQKFTF